MLIGQPLTTNVHRSRLWSEGGRAGSPQDEAHLHRDEHRNRLAVARAGLKSPLAGLDHRFPVEAEPRVDGYDDSNVVQHAVRPNNAFRSIRCPSPARAS